MKFKATLLSLALATSAMANAELNLKVFQAEPQGFSVSSTLVTGDKEAMVIDTGFTKADALRIVANVLDSNKELTTILISNADPDYYFGAETLKQFFPNAKVVSTQAVVDEIKAKLANKLEVWVPQMGANAPKTPIIPEVLKDNTLTVDGEKVEIRGTQGTLANRPYVWIPSLKTITGNVSVYNNMHVWTADSQTKAEREAWIAQLDEMKALKPTKVIAGHSSDTSTDPKSIEFTQTYLKKFEKALEQGKNSDQVIATMDKAYPNLADKGNLELSAKVNKGEMKW
ncbi:MBL fold metallo-hydrolase [Haemophilus paracuniculus]|uniref:MBL fold metallo-hydrolase n=1 Tax=Haemophilus paracuniculus TaxID=734 RepID=A0A1T0AQP2_9PAST|nr:MBL fold metallo-hydrolase [Haemophilus paracuniculus]OOR98313.1 MBL fold metallo-hydrolase [Haemophilus paracuniculus]